MTSVNLSIGTLHGVVPDAHWTERPEPTGDIDNPEDIDALVRAFYRDAAVDEILGPVFEASDVDWPHHIDTLTQFWSWQLFGVRGYSGSPMVAHQKANSLVPFTDAHYERWLSLFMATVDSMFVGPNANLIIDRAHKIANAINRVLSGGQM